jgi:hypothetical protein
MRRCASAAAGRSNTVSGSRKALAIATLVCLFILSATAASASAELITYRATETIPVPPASNFAGEGGGDGWAVALSPTAVYNVFHHDGELRVACHFQANAEKCFESEQITEPGSGNKFSTSGHPGLFLDQHTGKLYVYVTRPSDGTAGVVCIDTTIAEKNPDPFCGFTALTGAGEAPDPGYSAVSTPMLVGSHWYAFNFVSGKEHVGDQNALMCFDVSTDAACAGQPYTVALGSGTIGSGLPGPSTAAIGSDLIIPLLIGGQERLACFDDTTQSTCAGSWPVSLPGGTFYVDDNGAPFPLLNNTGKLTGVCIPTGTDECFNLEGASTPTPAELPKAIGGTAIWDGASVQLGPRVYVPNGDTDQVDCFDYSTGKSCVNFPRTMKELGLLYTVNADPQRPSCIWVNSDDGKHQIQNFDAYTGEACGQGSIRVLASQFVVPQPQCTPAAYISLQVLKPAPSGYEGGQVAFDDADGNAIGLPERALDGTGTASLEGLELNTPLGLPQFLFTLNGLKEALGAVEVQLTWVANYDPICTGENTTVVTSTPTPPPPAKPATTAVLAAKSVAKPTGTAHLASSKACVASSGYHASVSGKNIKSVTYTLDGHKLKTVTHSTHGAFALTVHVSSGKAHHLSISVTFTSASHTKPVTFHKTLARCAARVLPRFTG